MIIQNAEVYLEDHRFHKTGISFDKKINAIGEVEAENAIDAEGRYLVPGFIDLHTHGAMGADHSDGTVESIETTSAYYAKNGVTSFCPTTMTLPEDVLVRAVRAAKSFCRKPSQAKCIGVYLEGPFVSMEKRGAQNAEYVHKPDFAMLKRILEAGEGAVVACTVAPEEEGGQDFIKEASKLVKVSIAHTAADYDTAMEAFRNGASRVTHLYNAMPPYLHRNPGVIGAVMDSDCFAELICDGHHHHPCVDRNAFAAFPGKLALISDSLRCAGLPDGEYELGGQQTFLKGGVAKLADGTIAGSCINLSDAVRYLISNGVSPEEVFRAASENPAKAIGVFDDRGSITAGKCADFVLLNRDYSVHSVYIDGVQVK